MTKQEQLLDRVLRGLLIGIMVLCVVAVIVCWFWLGAQKHG